MRHAERAVYSATVFDHDVARVLVALIAEVRRAKAVVKSDRAAEVALPINLLFTVLLAFFHTSSVGLHLALFAAKVFLLYLVFIVELLLAVNHASEVWLLAVIALIESA